MGTVTHSPWTNQLRVHTLLLHLVRNICCVSWTTVCTFRQKQDLHIHLHEVSDEPDKKEDESILVGEMSCILFKIRIIYLLLGIKQMQVILLLLLIVIIIKIGVPYTKGSIHLFIFSAIYSW